MGEGDIAKPSRTAGIALAVVALVVAVFAVVTLLSGPVVYDEGDSEIAVSAGDRFSVRLKDDPGTGYRWVIAAPEPDPAVLRAVGSHFDSDAPPGENGSGGGSRYLEFEATGVGRTDLRLLHCLRCGTPGAVERGARSVNFRVTVR
ncbi:protease inhibitor I42 family protein [Streptomyces sp. MST-110588]|uniref:protease inhibitor I42 family protein n=1 Tax=Streptomyces sp. MST-110588 TaxID=2833628 RepID=UPI001F5CA217|nr:protease inhibitor I42 family protein [Streptomyces sp. MST-110588]UNO41668.1 protease inhibitor I42 family protein [Streptomyces sp. MST-110588]